MQTRLAGAGKHLSMSLPVGSERDVRTGLVIKKFIEDTMRYTMYLTGLILVLFVSLTYWSCASKPEAELQMAQKVMDEAEAQNAADLAPDDWARGRQVWNEAQALIEMGRHSEAKSLLIKANDYFVKALEIAKNRQDGLIHEVEELQSNIDTQYKTLKQETYAREIPKALSKKLGEAFPWIDEKIAEMEGAVAQKHYMDARVAGKDALGRIYELQTQLNDYENHSS